MAMTTPTIPMRAVTDTSVLSGLKWEGKAVWKGEDKTVKSKGRKSKLCCFKAWQIQDEIHGAVWKPTLKSEAHNRLNHKMWVVLNIN